MVDLSKARFLGKGSSRVCYVHPEDDRKCVKVTYSGNMNVVRDEMKYYRRYVRRGVSWEMMARMYGYINTSIGQGVVFSLARDYDGEISKSLDTYLRSECGQLSAGALRHAIMEFRVYLFSQRIIVRELKPDNLIYQKLSPERGKLILVDGVGNNEFLPVADYSAIFANRTLSRKWKKFERLIRESFCADLIM